MIIGDNLGWNGLAKLLVTVAHAVTQPSLYSFCEVAKVAKVVGSAWRRRIRVYSLFFRDSQIGVPKIATFGATK